MLIELRYQVERRVPPPFSRVEETIVAVGNHYNGIIAAPEKQQALAEDIESLCKQALQRLCFRIAITTNSLNPRPEHDTKLLTCPHWS